MSRQSRGWLVRIDPELFRDEQFSGGTLTRNARGMYLDSMMHVAAHGGPDDWYPHAATMPREASDVAALVGFGLWLDLGLGYKVRPYRNLICIVPERRSYISDKVRRQVYDRDEYACVTCGSTGALTLDHVWPWSLGGCDEVDNLQTMCRLCNCRKGARV